MSRVFECSPIGRDVHVWRVDASVPPDRIVLSEDERLRAGRFLNEAARTTFIACRTALRNILAGYLAREPLALRFGYREHGKLFLAGAARRDICFNCSHSGDVALIAVTCGREVGVDVERVRDLNFLELADRFFAPGEIAFVRQAPPQCQRAAFFECWTRKEALMKAVGVGLSHPPQVFDVSSSLGIREARLEHSTPLRTTWTMCSLEIDNHSPAAVVAEGNGGRVVLRSA